MYSYSNSKYDFNKAYSYIIIIFKFLNRASSMSIANCDICLHLNYYIYIVFILQKTKKAFILKFKLISIADSTFESNSCNSKV